MPTRGSTTAFGNRIISASASASGIVACTHCGLAVPPALCRGGDEHQFCCAGCRAIFTTLSSHGLEAYYALRDAAGATGRRADDATAGAGKYAASTTRRSARST